jgi:hypothetical protein
MAKRGAARQYCVTNLGKEPLEGISLYFGGRRFVRSTTIHNVSFFGAFRGFRLIAAAALLASFLARYSFITNPASRTFDEVQPFVADPANHSANSFEVSSGELRPTKEPDCPWDLAIAAAAQVSVAAKKGAILAGRKGPVVWLRYGLRQRSHEPKSTAVRLGHTPRLPYGNFGCPAATAPLAGTVVEAVVWSPITRS